MTATDVQAELSRLRTENAQLKLGTDIGWALEAYVDTRLTLAALCKLPQNLDRLKVELSGRIHPGGSHENESIQRNVNCRHLETSRCRDQGERPVSGTWD